MHAAASLRRASSIAAFAGALAGALIAPRGSVALPEDTQAQSQGVVARVGELSTEIASALYRDYETQLLYPMRYAGRNPGRFTLICAGLTTLVLADPVTYEGLASNETVERLGLSKAAERLTEWGNTPSTVPLVLGFGAIGVIADSPRERKTSLMLAEALVTAATWSELLKWASGRERPRDAEDYPADWAGPGTLFSDEQANGRRLRSFPSGHSTGIWAVATVLAHQYPSHGIVPVLAYGTAVSIGYSRMVLGSHWLSDVVVGGLIGYGCARQVLSAHEAPAREEHARRLSVGVHVGGGYKGLILRYDF